MMRRWMAAGFGAIALWACAPTQETPPPSLATASPAAGQVLAERYCVACHAIGPAGDSHNPEAPPLRTLATRYPVTALEEAFAEGILVGHPAMPEFRFTEAQIDDLVAYLESIQERRGG